MADAQPQEHAPLSERDACILDRENERIYYRTPLGSDSSSLAALAPLLPQTKAVLRDIAMQPGGFGKETIEAYETAVALDLSPDYCPPAPLTPIIATAKSKTVER